MNEMVFFFSYARQDAGPGSDCLLEKFYKELDSRIGGRLGKNLPCSHKDTDMDTGAVWPEANQQGLQKCPLLVFILSPYYQNSNFGGKELTVFLERREHMRKMYPQLPNLIFPVRWIPLRNSGLRVPKSIKQLNSSNYGMTGNIMRDGLKKLIEEDPRNYHKFMHGLVDSMLDALQQLNAQAPDYLARIPPTPDFLTTPSAFWHAPTPGPPVHDGSVEPPLFEPDQEPPTPPAPPHGKPGIAEWIFHSAIFRRLAWFLGASVAGLALFLVLSKTSPHHPDSNQTLDTTRINIEIHWPQDDAHGTKSASHSPNKDSLPRNQSAFSGKPQSGHNAGDFFAPITDYFFGEPLAFATGAPKKSFSKVFADINAVCGGEVRLKEVFTTGGWDNLGELASKRASLGLVGVDIYQAMEATDEAIGHLKAVMTLNTDLLHILVLKSGYRVETDRRCTGKELQGRCVEGDWIPVFRNKVIEKDADLKGLTVAAVGSAKVVARRHLNSNLNMNLHIVDVDNDAEAQADLKAGKVQAVLTLGAFPCGPIGELKQSDGFALANWESGATGAYKTMVKNYKNIGSFGITFLSTQNLIMARPVDPNGKIGRKITRLKACITSHLDQLKEGEEYEASWPDVASVVVPDGIPAW